MMLRLIFLSAVLAALGGAGWYIDNAAYARGVRDVRNEVQKVADDAQKRNEAVHREQIENLMEATHAKDKRIQTISGDHDRALRELDGLRTAARAWGGGSMPGADSSTVTERPNPIADVLGQCSAELVRMAGAADAHAADALMLQQAWPK
jgi:hypothetical protein